MVPGLLVMSLELPSMRSQLVSHKMASLLLPPSSTQFSLQFYLPFYYFYFLPLSSCLGAMVYPHFFNLKLISYVKTIAAGQNLEESERFKKK